MTRSELIELVKVKLEEISPFDEPQSFIAAAGDADYDKVKPIISYIDQTLDKAGVNCLNNLPLSLLSKDVVKVETTAIVDSKGVGHIIQHDYSRLVRVHTEHWQRDCTMFITTEDERYLLQQNRYTRGGTAKPLVAYNPEWQDLELYSFPASDNSTDQDVILWHIPLYANNTERAAETISSPIHDYIALDCAVQVLEIMGNTQQSAALKQEYETKLESVLQ